MSGEWGFHTPPEQQAQVDARFKKARNLAARRPLPNDVQLHHSTRQTSDLYGHEVSTHHTVRAIKHFEDGTINRQVGELTWSGASGGVGWLEGEPQIVPHLMAKAHQVSVETGDAPPLHGDELSPYSYRMLRKQMPEALTPQTKVEGVPLLTDQHFAQLHAHVNQAQATIAAPAAPGGQRAVADLAHLARESIVGAQRAHRGFMATWNDPYSGKKYRHLDDYDTHKTNFDIAVVRMVGLASEAGISDHPHVTALKQATGVLHEGRMNGGWD